MIHIDRGIGADHKNTAEYVDSLAGGKFLVPAFECELVWEPDDTIKPRDSILQFYQVGSILQWQTAGSLHRRRKPGGPRDVPQWGSDSYKGDFK